MTDPVEDTQHVQLLFECDATSDTTWFVGNARFNEGLNRPYTLELQLSTTNEKAEPINLLGQSCSLTMTRGTQSRLVTGMISEVEEGSTHPTRIATNIVVEPAFQALRHRVDTRIFQNETVPQILEKVIGKALEPYNRKVELKVSRTYAACEYRTQYDETDLDFCHRLMEEEGIFYFFDFSGTTEKLVLADDKSNYGEIKSIHENTLSKVLLHTPAGGGVGGHEYVGDLHLFSQLRPTKVAMKFFDWTHSTAPQEGDSSSGEKAEDFPLGSRLEPARETYEHDDRAITFSEYDEGKRAYEKNDVKDQTKIRRQSQAFDGAVADGSSSVFLMTVGAIFELINHPWPDLNGKFLVISCTHTYVGGEGSHHGYENEFRCIPEAVTFRPKRRTPKPRIESIETATVVGGSGEEITTDKHGRIKVQFHWDRKGENNDGSSCFMRVLQPWAGQGWGHVFIPRHKMEVEVVFINGDPDKPLVLGAVYNDQNTPPYTLPDEKTKSTIKTSSSLGGKDTKYNELRFEDKAGSEQIFTRAQKDYDEVILNCHTTSVGANQTNKVHRNQKQVIDVDQTEQVVGKQTMTVEGEGGNRKVYVKGAFTETIGKGHKRKVTGGVKETITGGETRTVHGAVTETIGTTRTQIIDKDSKEMITGTLEQTIPGGATITSPQGYSVEAQCIELTGVAQITEVSTEIYYETYSMWVMSGIIEMCYGINKHQFLVHKIDLVPIADFGAYISKIRNGYNKTDLYGAKVDFYAFKATDAPYKKRDKPIGASADGIKAIFAALTKKG